MPCGRSTECSTDTSLTYAFAVFGRILSRILVRIDAAYALLRLVGTDEASVHTAVLGLESPPPPPRSMPNSASVASNSSSSFFFFS